MDHADIANELADMERSVCLTRARAVPKRLQPCGMCYYCSENAPQGASFCGPDCRDDYELKAKLRRQNGGSVQIQLISSLAVLIAGAVAAGAVRALLGA